MGPIRGQTRPLPVTAEIAPETQRIDAKLNASIHNRFDIEVINAETGDVRQRVQAKNVICNQLWSFMFGGTAWNAYIQYGSGTGTPAASDTALFSYVGSDAPTTVSRTYDKATGIFRLQRKIRLSETTAVGKTLTEVGIGAASSSSLCTHAMLTDMNGNQISIAKTATDIINIYATVYCHVAGDFKKYFAFGVNSNVFSFAVGVGSGNPNPFLSSPYFIGSGGAVGVGTTFERSVSDKKVTTTFSRIGASAGNYGGLVAVIDVYSNGGAIYVDDAWYPGSVITGEAIGTGDGTTKDFATASGFVKPGAKIYVNGVEDTTATVDSGTPTELTNPTNYLRMIDTEGNATEGAFAKIVGNSEIIMYNPHFATLGLLSLKTNEMWAYCYASNDLINWTNIADFSPTPVSIPTAYKNYKYFKFTRDTGTNPIYIYIASTDCSGKNIHFAVAPASGAVITADYTTDCIAKDANHVFDSSFTIQFGPHTV